MWISPTRLELAVYRVCVYISLMTRGELVMILQSVCCPKLSGATTGILCAAYLDNIFG